MSEYPRLELIPGIVEANPEGELILGAFGIDAPGHKGLAAFTFNIFKYNLAQIAGGHAELTVDDERHKVIIADLANDLFRDNPIEEALADVLAHEYIHFITGVNTPAMHAWPTPFPDIYQYGISLEDTKWE